MQRARGSFIDRGDAVVHIAPGGALHAPPRGHESPRSRWVGLEHDVSEFHHGHEPRAEEIALHQKYLTLEGQIDAARLEGDEAEARHLTPLVKRAKAR